MNKSSRGCVGDGSSVVFVMAGCVGRGAGGLLVWALVACASPTVNVDAPALVPAAPLHRSLVGSEIGIFGDQLEAGWSDWSWAEHSLTNPVPVSMGTKSISVAFHPWSALQFLRPGQALDGLDALEFDANGGVTEAPALIAYVVNLGTVGPRADVGPHCAGGRIPANAWTHCRVPLTELGFTTGTVDGVELQEGSGRQLPTMFLDGVMLTGGSSGAESSVGAVAWLYRDGLDPAWVDGSWARHDVANSAPVFSGTRSMSVTLDPWTGVAFATPGFPTAGRSMLTLWVNGSGNAVPALLVRALVGSEWTRGTLLAPSCAGALPSNPWIPCDVLLNSVAPPNAVLTSIAIQEGRGIQVPTFYLDDIGIDVVTAPPGRLALSW